ncbi:hypothetical protein BpHYR1_011731 [Brachionus plicatilis]|uniref:Uncharacterized protein n=1 Tax=Brachionus plicatilis TaxID=10195 RepID=A0A3M7Q7W0_BRAPC|nr:hypothetical protein BpHYR1_011731 [Brachionus plicatilis]
MNILACFKKDFINKSFVCMRNNYRLKLFFFFLLIVSSSIRLKIKKKSSNNLIIFLSRILIKQLKKNFYLTLKFIRSIITKANYLLKWTFVKDLFLSFIHLLKDLINWFLKINLKGTVKFSINFMKISHFFFVEKTVSLVNDLANAIKKLCAIIWQRFCRQTSAIS